VVDGQQCAHKYFDSPHDIALGLSTDGFAPFHCHKHTCWPLIIRNYHLPLGICMHLKYVLPLGAILGPNKPKDFNSYMWLVVKELMKLELSVHAFDVMSLEAFTLQAYLICVFSDIPAISMIMHMTVFKSY